MTDHTFTPGSASAICQENGIDPASVSLYGVTASTYNELTRNAAGRRAIDPKTGEFARAERKWPTSAIGAAVFAALEDGNRR